MARSGAALTAPTRPATAMTTAQLDTAVNVTTPQPDTRVATTAVTPAAAAASNTFGMPGAPGTATKPATAANAVAMRLNASPAVWS